MTTDTAPLGGIPTIGTPVATLSLVGGRQRPVKIVEHPAFRGRPRHEHPHPGFPPTFLALPVRVVSLNDPARRPVASATPLAVVAAGPTTPCAIATAA
jgi:hypothetical protein